MLALANQGLRDPVLSQRVYAEFMEGVGAAKSRLSCFDFRKFLLALMCIANENLEEKLLLVFEVYDLDGSGTLSMEEVKHKP